MNIDKAFEKWWKKDQESQGIMKAHFSIAYLEKKVSLRAWKQSRIDTLDKIRTKIFNESLDLKTLNYIDTELANLRSE